MCVWAGGRCHRQCRWPVVIDEKHVTPITLTPDQNVLKERHCRQCQKPAWKKQALIPLTRMSLRVLRAS